MGRLQSFIAGLVVVVFLASGCGKTQTAGPSSKNATAAARMDNAPSAADMESKAGGTSATAGENPDAGQQTSTDTATQEVAAAPLAGEIPMQFLDSRLQDTIRNFQTASNRMNRSTMAGDMLKLVDAGVPKPQIASALGYLYSSDNSVDVKVDILSALGDLEDPSAFDPIVRGLDPHQPDEIHDAAIEALDSLGDKRAIPLIQPFLSDRDQDVRESAQSALDSLTDQ
ncbi:MAG TPA: HEAT repeat domain-containing protein [Verrucomicrobiae bacterium]|nr:HEAT repeat domain-containing protein [Verrucomicrobiae bacterium]